MSQITFLGHASFKIETPLATIITDPFDPNFLKGYTWLEQTADILLISHAHEDHSFKAGVKGAPFVIDTPGEYEVKGVSVFGVASFHDNKKGVERGGNVIYGLGLPEGVKVVHLGDLGQVLESSQIEALGRVDVLLIPVGGKFTLGPKMAKQVVDQLGPKLVIPMHYGQAGKITAEWNLKGVEEFLEEMGASGAEKVRQLKLKSEADLPEETQVVVMQEYGHPQTSPSKHRS